MNFNGLGLTIAAMDDHTAVFDLHALLQTLCEPLRRRCLALGHRFGARFGPRNLALAANFNRMLARIERFLLLILLEILNALFRGLQPLGRFLVGALGPLSRVPGILRRLLRLIAPVFHLRHAEDERIALHHVRRLDTNLIRPQVDRFSQLDARARHRRRIDLRRRISAHVPNHAAFVHRPIECDHVVVARLEIVGNDVRAHHIRRTRRQENYDRQGRDECRRQSDRHQHAKIGRNRDATGFTHQEVGFTAKR